jgi:hypothetical protein
VQWLIGAVEIKQRKGYALLFFFRSNKCTGIGIKGYKILNSLLKRNNCHGYTD